MELEERGDVEHDDNGDESGKDSDRQSQAQCLCILQVIHAQWNRIVQQLRKVGVSLKKWAIEGGIHNMLQANKEIYVF